MKFADRYARASRTSDLRSRAQTEVSASDVLGAAGLAAKERPGSVALLHILTGDPQARDSVVEWLASMVDGRAFRTGAPIPRSEARELASAVLAWCCEGHCRTCNGLGFQLVPGTPHLSGSPCPSCRGTKRVQFEMAFTPERLPLALWVREKIERELALAGSAATRRLGMERHDEG